MCGLAGILPAQPSPGIRRFGQKGAMAATLQNRQADDGGLFAGSGACPETLLTGDADHFSASATCQPKVMS